MEDENGPIFEWKSRR